MCARAYRPENGPVRDGYAPRPVRYKARTPPFWPDAVQPDTVLYTSTAPKWLDKAENCTLRYGEEEPGLTLRPGRSILWEEAQTVAVQ